MSNKTLVRVGGITLSFTDDDVVDLDDVLRDDPYGGDLWLLHDHGFTLCVVEADHLPEALDAAVDADKLDRFQINLDDPSERADWMTKNVVNIAPGFDPECPDRTDADGTQWWWQREPTFLGNALEPFDIETLGFVKLPLPKRSLTRLFGEEVEVSEASDYHFA